VNLPQAVIDATLAATWPPARSWQHGPWTLRDGAGGGKRVSAATTDTAVGERDITAAEAAMDDAGQQALFQVRPDQSDLDARLDDRGYLTVDPTVLYHAPVARVAGDPPPPVTGFGAWPPLQIQHDIWAAGGIGPARVAVMERVAVPKIAILGRARDQPAATVFVAAAGDIAMIHALETRPKLRRNGAGRTLIGHAAHWARKNGATTLTLLVTRANDPANALYRSLGMAEQPCYHYRIRP